METSNKIGLVLSGGGYRGVAHIGVYVNPLPKIKKKDLNTTKTIVNRAYTISRFKVIETKFNDCDVLISPIEVGEYDVFSKVHVDRIFRLGYTDAKIKLKKMMS